MDIPLPLILAFLELIKYITCADSFIITMHVANLFNVLFVNAYNPSVNVKMNQLK